MDGLITEVIPETRLLVEGTPTLYEIDAIAADHCKISLERPLPVRYPHQVIPKIPHLKQKSKYTRRKGKRK